MMLSKEDIGWIKSIREDVRENRTEVIAIESDNVVDKHPITGEPINKPLVFNVDAVVTEISVRTAVDRYQTNGIEIRTGDVIFDVSLSDVPEGVTGESIRRIKHRDLKHKVLSADYLGIGEVNRLEMLGRRII